MHASALKAASFDLNQKLDIPLLSKAYRGSGRLHIANFLSPASALRLYEHLTTEILWRTFLVANGRRLGTPENAKGPLNPEHERQMLELAHEGARNGFASIFDADRVLPEDGAPAHGTNSGTAELTAFLNYDLLNVLRQLTGIADLSRIDAHATRFRPGHFVTFHNAVPSADKTGQRRASFSIDVTPEWRPEWGGLMEFRSQDECHIEGIQPCFNGLNLFTFPHGHWISTVAPLAQGPRYALQGHVYVD